MITWTLSGHIIFALATGITCGIVAARYLSQEGHAPAIDPLPSLQPQVEPEAIHGSHRSLVGVLARIVPGDQP